MIKILKIVKCRGRQRILKIVKCRGRRRLPSWKIWFLVVIIVIVAEVFRAVFKFLSLCSKMVSFISGALSSCLLIKSLFLHFFAKSISLSKEPIIGFWVSNAATSLNNNAKRFSVLYILFSIGSSLCLILASLNLPLVTNRSLVPSRNF